MPSIYLFHTTLRNSYLGVSKVIRATTRRELDWLVNAQIAKWNEQESKKRQQKAKDEDRLLAKQEAEGLKIQADAYTEEAKERLEFYRSILRNSSPQSLSINWDLLIDRNTYRPFVFHQPKPDKDQIRLDLLGPPPKEDVIPEPVVEKPSPFEVFLPFLRRKRRERDELAIHNFEQEKRAARTRFAKHFKIHQSNEFKVVKAFNLEVSKYNAALHNEKQNYIEARDEFVSRQKAHNETILDLKARYEKGSADGVEQLVSIGLDKSSCPDGISSEFELQFDSPASTLVLNFTLPKPADVPNIVEYKYIAARKTIKPIEMKAKDFEGFYDDVLHQIALRAVQKVFVVDYANHILAVVFNGWVSGIDAKTGKEYTSCILSFEASRQKFMDLNLAHVSPKECVRGFKGITAGPLAMLAPVKPIMDIKRDDDRFVESRPVVDYLQPEENLAAMDWEDFEHLIRELFEKEFAKSGGEVRITQASRDRGVDAIAFDEDPIRGGKFVIQAKRYNLVVPVSAVRDLYGTMINEGAVKGILVTTSHFGRDSREFAKDKPITLIDGENLVYMFQKFGRDVHISILPKGDPRRGI